jgi:exosortase/archaeosortase family protein
VQTVVVTAQSLSLRSRLAVFSSAVAKGRLLANREEQSFVAILVVSFVTLLALALDNWSAPALHNSSPFWTIGFFLALALHRRFRGQQKEAVGTGWRWSWPRMAAFLLLHAGIVSLARIAGPVLVEAARQTSLVSWAITSLKYMVLAPTLVLLAPADWLRLWRAYRAEVIVAAGVLLTWNPYRLFATVWPWYSGVLGRFVKVFASLFVPGLGYVSGVVPTFLGSHLNVSIIFACSGLDGVLLFQRLFGLMLIVDWIRLDKRRLPMGYFAGLTAMLAANALRIAFLVVLGNRVSAHLVERYHINAGWIFVSGVFIAYLISCYSWLLGGSVRVEVSPAWGRPATSSTS